MKTTLPLLSSKLILYILYTVFVSDSSLTIVDTMLNPILSDYFGFTTSKRSLFFFGIVILLATSNGIL